MTPLEFAGNGEPTMHPRFPAVVDRVLATRDELDRLKAQGYVFATQTDTEAVAIERARAKAAAAN